MLDSEPMGRGKHGLKISGTFVAMESIRQKRINSLLQHDLAEVFRALAAAEFPGTLITVSKYSGNARPRTGAGVPQLFPHRPHREGHGVHSGARIRELKTSSPAGCATSCASFPTCSTTPTIRLEYEANIDRLLREGGENPFK